MNVRRNRVPLSKPEGPNPAQCMRTVGLIRVRLHESGTGDVGHDRCGQSFGSDFRRSCGLDAPPVSPVSSEYEERLASLIRPTDKIAKPRGRRGSGIIPRAGAALCVQKCALAKPKNHSGVAPNPALTNRQNHWGKSGSHSGSARSTELTTLLTSLPATRINRQEGVS